MTHLSKLSAAIACILLQQPTPGGASKLHHQHHLSPNASTPTSLIVNTTSGELHGTVNTTSPNVRQFLGIPYATPPVGPLRFQPPEPFLDAHTPRDASAFAPSCLQPIRSAAEVAGDVFFQYLNGFLPGSAAQSEDCLYLNVYTPQNPVEALLGLLPVFIWIHGGAFTSDGANVPYQIPDAWIERTQGHVVVTLNYRLNIFGFPNAAGQPINVGFLDQRLAVEWARDNIAAFHGDPARMVLWGQSAGAWSANYYGYAYPDDPIVTGLISDSGGSSVFGAANDGHSNFTVVAARLGCSSSPEATNSSNSPAAAAAEELACVQTVPAPRVQQAASAVSWSGGIDGVTVFQGTADNVTVFADYAARAAHGLVARLPAILGVNAREGADLAAAGLWTAAGGVEESVQVERSKVIVCENLAELGHRRAAGLTTYRYLYAGNFSNVTPLAWIGASHSCELPLLFGTHAQFNGNSTEFEWAVSFAMQDLWLSFASDTLADPTYQSYVWSKWSPEAPDTVAVFAAGVEEAAVVVQAGSAAAIDGICA